MMSTKELSKWLAKIRIAHQVRGRSSGLSACFVLVELYEAGQGRRRAAAQQQVKQHADEFWSHILIASSLIASGNCVNMDVFGERRKVRLSPPQPATSYDARPNLAARRSRPPRYSSRGLPSAPGCAR